MFPLKHEKPDKKRKYMIVTFLAGSILTGVIFYTDSQKDLLKEDNRIQRNELGQGDYLLRLNSRLDGKDRELNLRIDERIPEDQELLIMAKEANDKIDPLILGANASFDCITEDLSFPLKLAGYPFTLRWTSSDEDRRTHTGRVIRDPEDDLEYEVTIETVFVYRDFRQSFHRTVKSVPAIYEEEKLRGLKLDKSIDEALYDSRNSSVIILPSNIDGQQVTYSEKTGNNGIIMLIFTFVMTAVIGLAVSFDEQRSSKKRTQMLQALYPGFVEKMKLYMISGMTAKNSLFAIREDLKRSGKKSELLLSELERACNRYANGVSEEKILTDLGNSCGEAYRKFCFLLIVNLKQGNDRLMELMNAEVDKAFAMRREKARSRGEEASVKLLFPMLIMLLIVLVLIMIPAYMKFS